VAAVTQSMVLAADEEDPGDQPGGAAPGPVRRHIAAVRAPGDRRTPRTSALLEAARMAFRTFGPTASMDQIAACAGVTKPIVYRHVGPRAELLELLTDEWVERYVAGSKLILASDVTAHEATRALIALYVDQVASDQHVYAAIATDRMQLDAHRRRISRIAGTLSKVLTPSLVDAGRSAVVADVVSQALVGAVHYATDYCAAVNAAGELLIEESTLVDQLTDLVWNGIAPYYATTLAPVTAAAV
jgi:AcrR family transcriptional regulator